MHEALGLGVNVLHALSKLCLGRLVEVVRGGLQLGLHWIEVQVIHRHCLWLHVQGCLRTVLQ